MDDAMATIRDLVVDVDGEERPVLELLAEELQMTADEVTEVGAAASVTFKLTVKPERKHGRTTVSINPDISRTHPKRALGGVIRFNRNGKLSRSDTRQPQLPLRTVGNDTDVRQAVDDTAITREA